MEKISSFQLFSFFVLFEIGTTIVFGFANAAGRDVWVATIASVSLGVLVLWMYTTLMKWQPGLTLVEWFPQQFGRYLGTPIAWLYPLAFLYVAGRDLRDFCELLNTTILQRTPMFVIMFAFLVVVVYGISQGLETLARIGEFLFPIVTILYLLQIVLICSSNILRPDQFQPIMEYGWKNLWKTVWPTNVTVPYGEAIVFAMFWTKLNRTKKMGRIAFFATLYYGIFILSADLLAIMVLGDQMFMRSLYPLYSTVKLISASDFIENLDPIVILDICIMVFFKVSLFMLGAVDGIQQLTAVKGRQALIYPSAVLVLLFAMTMARNVWEHMEAGLKVVPNVLWIPLYLVLPFLLLVVVWTRRRFGQAKGVNGQDSSGS